MTLCDQTQYVHYLSPTEDGRQHDKKLADEYAPSLPVGSVLRQDLGAGSQPGRGGGRDALQKAAKAGIIIFAEAL